MHRFQRSLLSGAAALAIIAGASNLSTAQAQDMWDGLFVGIDLSAGVVDLEGVHQGLSSAAFSSDISGLLGGAHIGYNHRNGNVVFGVEADLLIANWSKFNLYEDSNSSTITAIEDSVNLLGSIRGRVGILPREDVLVYATAGVGFVNAKHRVVGSYMDDFQEYDLSDVGVVVGAGVEWRPPGQAFTLRAQGLFFDFSKSVDTSETVIGSPDSGDFGMIDGAMVFTVGANLPLN